MCRSIKPLRTSEGAASAADIEAAALQFVRKVSDFRTPPKANPDAFAAAVAEITAATERLLAALPPKRGTKGLKD